MKVGVVTFPGSNCDHDCFHVVQAMGHEVVFLWHAKEDLQNCEAVVLPGGFSYGDYLRAGALARFSPIMKAVTQFAQKGGLVLGICNGFQILLEAGLLPGVMLKNKSLQFICKPVALRVENHETPFTRKIKGSQVLRMPIAHGMGNYFADGETLSLLKKKQQIVFRYEGENPNGAIEAIAGICNEKRNILGMMPHPERSCESLLGSEDGRLIFSSFLEREV